MSAPNLLHRFIRGLKPEVQKEVELKDPKTWEEAVRMAERADAVFYSLHRDQRARRINLNTVAVQTTDRSPKETRVCHYCKKPGHLIKDCRKRQVKAKRQ